MFIPLPVGTSQNYLLKQNEKKGQWKVDRKLVNWRTIEKKCFEWKNSTDCETQLCHLLSLAIFSRNLQHGSLTARVRDSSHAFHPCQLVVIPKNHPSNSCLENKVQQIGPSVGIHKTYPNQFSLFWLGVTSKSWAPKHVPFVQMDLLTKSSSHILSATRRQ